MVSQAITYVRPGLIVVRHNRWIETEKSLFDSLAKGLIWKQGSIYLFGRNVYEPRLTAWMGDVSYVYSGRTLEPRPWLPAVKELRESINAHLNTFVRTPFGLNHCLINWYRAGSDSMGWHQDNETALGYNPVIASVSLGQRRRFRLRHKRFPRRFDTISFELGHGDLLIMYGQTQHSWEHQVPKTSRDIGSRMNLTFRSVASCH